MIESTIGRIFLDAYNEKYGTNYDAKKFFVEQYYPLFYNHNKYMMTAGNSPLENPKLSWDEMLKGKKPYETAEQHHERFVKLMKKMEAGEADASIARGFPTIDVNSTTSGQVTDMRLPMGEEELYLSWIGDSLGVGVQGGFSILFFHEKVLLDIFQGWKYYRQALNSSSKLKGNQINAWNGQWLAHRYDLSLYDEANPMADFSPYSSKDGLLSVDSITWTKVLISIARHYKEVDVLGYIYNIGQTNKTIGFVPFILGQIRRPLQLYELIFGFQDARKAEHLWGTAIGLRTACMSGAIGLKAMEPKGLRNYMQGNLPKPEKDEQQKISYNTYKIWILAMLNNDELWDESQKLAQLLMDSSIDKDKKISRKNSNAVETVLKAVNKKQFVDAVTALVPAMGSVDELSTIVKDIHSMPADNVPYFLTLVRFQYAAINTSNR